MGDVVAIKYPLPQITQITRIKKNVFVPFHRFSASSPSLPVSPSLRHSSHPSRPSLRREVNNTSRCHRHGRSCNHGFQPMEGQSADEIKCHRYGNGYPCPQRANPHVPSHPTGQPLHMEVNVHLDQTEISKEIPHFNSFLSLFLLLPKNYWS